jgi:TPR repeat protein
MLGSQKVGDTSGKGTPRAKKEALQYQRHSAERGNPQAMYRVSWIESKLVGRDIEDKDAPA